MDLLEKPTTTFTRYDCPEKFNLRVYEVAHFAAGLLDLPPTDLFINIVSLYDYKGDLEVTWKEQPAPAERWALGHAWELAGNEIPDNVHHTVTDTAN